MRTIFIILLSFPFTAFGQILIDDVGDGWKKKVDSAIVLIKKVSPYAWAVLDNSTNRVEFWLGDRSSTRPDPNFGKGTILMAVDEIELGIVNMAAVLVHESLHLHFHQNKLGLEPNHEEITAYLWELVFLIQVPSCPVWLIKNAEYQISTLQSEK